jgi:hypothetical protein
MVVRKPKDNDVRIDNTVEAQPDSVHVAPDMLENVTDPVDIECHADASVLTAEQLVAGGMHRVEAWISTPSNKARRKARNEKYREQQAASGLTQVSVRVPTELAPALKELASKACETGELLTTDGPRVQLDNQMPSSPPDFIPQLGEMKSLLVTVSDDLSAGLLEAQQSNETLRAMLEEGRAREDKLRKRLSDLEAQDRQLQDDAALGRHVANLDGVRGFLISLLLREA